MLRSQPGRDEFSRFVNPGRQQARVKPGMRYPSYSASLISSIRLVTLLPVAVVSLPFLVGGCCFRA